MRENLRSATRMPKIIQASRACWFLSALETSLATYQDLGLGLSGSSFTGCGILHQPPPPPCACSGPGAKDTFLGPPWFPELTE